MMKAPCACCITLIILSAALEQQQSRHTASSVWFTCPCITLPLHTLLASVCGAHAPSTAAPNTTDEVQHYSCTAKCVLLLLWHVYCFVPAVPARDAIIVTSCGAEALPFISAFGVLPAFAHLLHALTERLSEPPGDLVLSEAVLLTAVLLCCFEHCEQCWGMTIMRQTTNSCQFVSSLLVQSGRGGGGAAADTATGICRRC